MRSQYRCSSSDKREADQEALIAHGYDEVYHEDEGDRRTLVVFHPEFYAGRVDYIVYRVDPAAQRTARSED
jgi:hypothetical protein